MPSVLYYILYYYIVILFLYGFPDSFGGFPSNIVGFSSSSGGFPDGSNIILYVEKFVKLDKFVFKDSKLSQNILMINYIKRIFLTAFASYFGQIRPFLGFFVFNFKNKKKHSQGVLSNNITIFTKEQ